MTRIIFENSILLHEDEDTNLEVFHELNELVQTVKQGKITGFKNKHFLLKGINHGMKVYQKGFGDDLNTKILTIEFV